MAATADKLREALSAWYEAKLNDFQATVDREMDAILESDDPIGVLSGQAEFIEVADAGEAFVAEHMPDLFVPREVGPRLPDGTPITPEIRKSILGAFGNRTWDSTARAVADSNRPDSGLDAEMRQQFLRGLDGQTMRGVRESAEHGRNKDPRPETLAELRKRMETPGAVHRDLATIETLLRGGQREGS